MGFHKLEKKNKGLCVSSCKGFCWACGTLLTEVREVCLSRGSISLAVQTETPMQFSWAVEVFMSRV